VAERYCVSTVSATRVVSQTESPALLMTGYSVSPATPNDPIDTRVRQDTRNELTGTLRPPSRRGVFRGDHVSAAARYAAGAVGDL
jgi:hypothetical protein